jgi:hypothetical protein
VWLTADLLVVVSQSNTTDALIFYSVPLLSQKEGSAEQRPAVGCGLWAVGCGLWAAFDN